MSNKDTTQDTVAANTQVKQFTRNLRNHTMFNSNMEDVLSDSESYESDCGNYNSDVSESESKTNNLERNNEKETDKSRAQANVSENMTFLQNLGKELEKAEAVSQKVERDFVQGKKWKRLCPR